MFQMIKKVKYCTERHGFKYAIKKAKDNALLDSFFLLNHRAVKIREVTVSCAHPFLLIPFPKGLVNHTIFQKLIMGSTGNDMSIIHDKNTSHSE